jgi:hypothetical protein
VNTFYVLHALPAARNTTEQSRQRAGGMAQGVECLLAGTRPRVKSQELKKATPPKKKKNQINTFFFMKPHHGERNN